jgi:hypothetical protein
MSGDWRRLHRVRELSGGSPENHRVPWLIHKTKTEYRRWRSTGLTDVRRCSLETLKQRKRVGIVRLASRLSKFAVVGYPSDGVMTKFPKWPFGSMYPSVRP